MTLPGFLHDNFVPHMPESVLKNTNRTEVSVENNHVGDDAKKWDNASVYLGSLSSVAAGANPLHRSLKGRHVQLIGIGATIGLALFVAIGKALAKGGPLSLLLGFLTWSVPILAITITVAEEVVYLPVPSAFVRMSGRCCDKALEVTTAWNFWFLCCAQIPFEVVTVNSILHFWRDDYSPAIPLAVQVVLYFLINVFGVSIYGEVEFWLSLGKVILATGLIIFTFIVMVGGNPQHDAFGFRTWQDPGAMNTWVATGDLGRFRGYLACVIQACFTFAGPEYVSLVAAELGGDIRKSLKSAYLQVFVRLTVFFIGGALCVGILVPYNDEALVASLLATKPGAGSSPYVIAMDNLQISVLPHIMNVLLVTAAFSAGNSYVYASSRCLYGLALDNMAPKFLLATTNTGIPLYCVFISLAWSLISFLQLGSQASEVLNWIISIITSCQLINFFILCFTYVFFYRALKAQGISRDTLPFKSWFQPYTAIFGAISAFVMLFVSTYETFTPGGWSVKTFLFSYLFIFIDIVLFVGYKLIRRTKWRTPAEVDLTTGLAEVEQHQQNYFEEMARNQKLDEKGNVKLSWSDRLLTFLFGSN